MKDIPGACGRVGHHFLLAGAVAFLYASLVLGDFAFAQFAPWDTPPEYRITPVEPDERETAFTLTPDSGAYVTFNVSIHPTPESNTYGSYALVPEGLAWWEYEEEDACTEWSGEEPYDCIAWDFPMPETLCPYIELAGEESDSGFGSWQGDLDADTNPDALWGAHLYIPCLRGTCPVNVNEANPLRAFPPELLDTELSCDITVEPYSNPVVSFLSPLRAIAQTAANTIRINATVSAAAPPEPVCTEDCYSNVAFLPGIKASRLYLMEEGEDENQLWEPTGIFDASQLYFDADGTPEREGIYTRDVIDRGKVFGLFPAVDVYHNFLSALDALKASGGIADWQALPYDWRFDPRDTVSDGVQYQHELRRMQADIEALAATSKSKKVTIVAHSMGGHMAKVLVDSLARDGKADLIDRVVFVAVPHFGTPQAIAALLHGYNERIPGWAGILVTSAEARALGKTLPTTYNLLPSQEYFNRVVEPVVDLSEARSLLTPVLIDDTLQDRGTLEQFLSGVGGRAAPSYGAIDTPAVLSETLLENSRQFHDMFDAWEAPEGIEVIDIIGWGLPTLSGIRYREDTKRFCVPFVPCVEVTEYEPDPQFTSEGDGTVVYVSADTGGERYFVNTGKYFLDTQDTYEHGALLEFQNVQNLITDLLRNITNQYPYISSNKPVESDTTKQLRISVYSPVELHMYDSEGRHTGRAYTRDGLTMIEEKVPGSRYVEMGSTKHILLPEGEYQVALEGESEGTFDLVVRSHKNGSEETLITYDDVPVASETKASVNIYPNEPQPLFLDVNGNGITDEIITPIVPGAPLVFEDVLEDLHVTVRDMALRPLVALNMQARVAIIRGLYKWRETLLEKEQTKKIEKKVRTQNELLHKVIADFISYVEKLAKKPVHHPWHLSEEDAEKLIALLEQLNDLVE